MDFLNVDVIRTALRHRRDKRNEHETRAESDIAERLR